MRGLDVPNAGTSDERFLASVDVAPDNDRMRARAKLVYKDVPLVTIQNTWSIGEARGAIYAHLTGQFYASAMLCDSIMGDDRVTATLNAGATALFRCEPCFKPANSSSAAKEVLDAWQAAWKVFAGDAALRQTHDYAKMMGFGHDQILWSETKGLAFGTPTLRPWHPVLEYFDWDLRRFMAIGSEAAIPIVGGNGKWLAHEPWGTYRGWLRGALRPVVEPWLLKHFGFRDMARFGEVHGNPTRVGDVPIVGDPIERQDFENALAGLGADAAMIVPGGVNEKDGNGYNYRLVEATSQAWKVHPAQIDRCDMAIILAILMVNLTTQIDEAGSYAAAESHAEKEMGGTQFDAHAWRNTWYTQLARPFAYLNFGDADLAPDTWLDVPDPRKEGRQAATAETFQKFGAAVEVARRAGLEFADADELRHWAASRLGLDDLPKFRLVDPVKQQPQKAAEGGDGAPPPNVK
jgi:hypothetical protein